MDLKLINASPLEFSLSFSPQDNCFQGHFPGNPVVPGSLILGLCLQAVLQFYAPQQRLQVKKFSFLKFVRPQTYTLSIVSQKNIFSCVLAQDGLFFARGVIEPCT